MVARMTAPPGSAEILELIRTHPEGVSIPELIREIRPNASYAETALLRTRIHERLTHLAQYGEIERIIEAEGHGRARKVKWRALQ